MDEEKLPLVTVAIPTYNNPSGLKNTLKYITEQTYKNLEIIVSDNNSPGIETKKIVEEFSSKDSRITYFKQKRNIGAWMNFYISLQKAKGDYFMWAGDDDKWLPLYIEKCVKALMNNQNLDLVITNYKVISEKGGPLNNYQLTINFNSLAKLDRKDALSLFILMDDSTHKAVLFLGLWKRESINEVMKSLPILYKKYKYWKGLDISILTYALTKINFYQIPERLFIKKYEQAAPGSLINRIKGIRDKFKNLFFKPKNSKKYYAAVYKQHIKDIDMIEESLKIGGLSANDLKKTISLKKSLFYLPIEIRVVVTAIIVFFLKHYYKLKKALK